MHECPHCGFVAGHADAMILHRRACMAYAGEKKQPAPAPEPEVEPDRWDYYLRGGVGDE